MPKYPSASPDDIQMSSVAAALKKNLVKNVLFGATAAGASYVMMSMMAERFQSQAELNIVSKSAIPDTAAINTHVKALQAAELIEKIADGLNLKDKAEFNPAAGPVDKIDGLMRSIGIGGPRAGESERDSVLAAFRNQLEVYSAKDSRFVGVRFTSTEPELAAEIANQLADSYRRSLQNLNVQEVDDQQTVLQAKIDKLAPEVTAAENEAQRYAAEINSFKGGPQNTDLDRQRMAELTGDLTKAQVARAEAEARSKSARELAKSGAADALPEVQKSPLIQNLVQSRVRIERQISELSATLLPGHPRMRQLGGDLASLKTQLSAEIGKIVESLDKEAKVAQAKEESIQKSIDTVKAKVVTNAPGETKLAELEAMAKAKRTELDKLRAQLEANKKMLDVKSQPVEVTIISRAQPASVPIYPRKLPSAALAFMIALLAGNIATFLRALFTGARPERPAPGGGGKKTKAKAPAMPAVSEAVPVPVHAEPNGAMTNGAASIQAAAAMQDEPLTAMPAPAAQSGAIISAARQLSLAAPASTGRRTLITGAAPGSSAADEAIALANALSDLGSHVVLINWDPAGGRLAQLNGADNGTGISDLVSGAASFDDVVRRVPGSGVHVIGSGQAASGSVYAVDPDQLNLVLDALDEAYEHIVITGDHDAAASLFETIQGRFDAGVIVGARAAAEAGDDRQMFLGFEVADLDIIHLERGPGAPQSKPAAASRLSWAQRSVAGAA